MWNQTQFAFHSVVAYDPRLDSAGIFTHLTESAHTHLLVRARLREDLEDLRRVIPEAYISERPMSDYDYGAVISRDQLKAYLNDAVDKIDYYSHFKEVVRDRASMPEVRYPAMGKVWSAFMALQTEDRRRRGKAVSFAPILPQLPPSVLDADDWDALAVPHDSPSLLDMERFKTYLQVVTSLGDFTQEERRCFDDAVADVYEELVRRYGQDGLPTVQQAQDLFDELQAKDPARTEGNDE